ncbi:MAG: proprotein convertase P-domain-containing protein [Acidobacteriota bacterium]|nr:MAG: proprotein convertase P-domain-containing protein [Acidobacteriota bacterium]
MTISSRAVLAFMGSILALSGAGFAAEPTIVGKVSPLRLETPHPYRAGDPDGIVVWRRALRHPGATYLTIHLERFELAPGDYLSIFDGAGKEQSRLYGRGPRGDGRNVWTPAVISDAVVLELRAFGRGSEAERFGLLSDRYAHGFRPLDDPDLDPQTDDICGEDNRRDAICYADSHPVEYEKARAVGRLLVNGFVVCTGFFVSCEGHMMTVSHCINTQEHVEGTQIWMMWERDGCLFGTPSFDRQLNGKELIRWSGPLDWALFTVVEDASEYGYLGLDPRLPPPGERFYMPAHHSGNVKMFGIESDSEPEGVCRITESPWSWSNDDLMYYCDTVGGSSGAPVISGETHRVIAINRTASSNCFDGNAGARMDFIFPQIEDALPACSFSPDPLLSGQEIFDTSGNGNGNGFADPGETIRLRVTISNTGTAPATGIVGTLNTTEPGVSITDETADFENVPDGGSGSTLAPHFEIALAESLACGARIPFQLDLATDQGAYGLSLLLEVGENLGGPIVYEATDVPRSIPDFDGGGTTSVLDVTDSFTIQDAFVRPVVTHTFIGDLVVELRAPSSTTVRLHDKTGWSRDEICFDYDRDVGPDGPGTMADFDGENAVGEWRLKVVDDAAFNSGTLESWQLELHPPDDFVCAPPLAANGPGEASDPSGAAPALLVTSYDGATEEVTISYAPACDATDHAAYSGALDAVAGLPWDEVACGLGTTGSATFDPGAESRFFVVVGQHASREGSYGRDSAGNERNEADAVGACDLPLESAGCP